METLKKLEVIQLPIKFFTIVVFVVWFVSEGVRLKQNLTSYLLVLWLFCLGLSLFNEYLIHKEYREREHKHQYGRKKSFLEFGIWTILILASLLNFKYPLIGDVIFWISPGWMIYYYIVGDKQNKQNFL